MHSIVAQKDMGSIGKDISAMVLDTSLISIGLSHDEISQGKLLEDKSALARKNKERAAIQRKLEVSYR